LWGNFHRSVKHLNIYAFILQTKHKWHNFIAGDVTGWDVEVARFFKKHKLMKDVGSGNELESR